LIGYFNAHLQLIDEVPGHKATASFDPGNPREDAERVVDFRQALPS
jgi:hypothetical protein